MSNIPLDLEDDRGSRPHLDLEDDRPNTGAPPAPSPSTARAMGLQGSTQSAPQLPAVDYGMGPIGNWAYRKLAPTRVGQAIGDVTTQALLAPGRAAGRAASDIAGLGRLAGAYGKAHPLVGKAIQVVRGFSPEQLEQGAQAVQAYERPFLETELQPETTAGQVTKKVGEAAGMMGEAALTGPFAPVAFGLQGAGARATSALNAGASPNKALAESALSGALQGSLAAFMPAGKVPTPEAGALWQLAKDVAIQVGSGAAVGAGMGMGENLISRIHDPNAPLTPGMGQSALEFAGYNLAHTLLRLPIYKDVADQRRAILDHPQGPQGSSADAQRMIDTITTARDGGMISPDEAQGHIDALTRMKNTADKIAATRAGKIAQAKADAATAQPKAAAPAEPAPAQPATPGAPVSYDEATIKAARGMDLFLMGEKMGLDVVGKSPNEIREMIRANQPKEVAHATETGQVEEGHPAEHQGGSEVSEGEGIVRQPEGKPEEANAVDRSGGLPEGGQVQEGAEGRPVDPEVVKEQNRETYESRLLQQIRPEFHERFLTDLDNARNTLDNRADTVLDRITPVKDQMEKLERAYARREARGRISSAEEGLEANPDYQRLRKEYESTLADGHAAIESVHDTSAVLADRYGLAKPDIHRAILGIGEEDGATKIASATEGGAEGRPGKRVPYGAEQPEVGPAKAELLQHVDEAGVPGGRPGTEGGAGTDEAVAETYPRPEGGKGPEAEGAGGGTAPEGIPGEGNGRAKAAEGEGGKAPDFSRPERAAEREHIVADSLGLQQLYQKGFDAAKSQMGLPEGATEMDLVREVGNRIGKLGGNIAETARKIMATVKGVGKDLATSIANLLHELNPFQGRAGELGAVGKVKGEHQEVIHDRINEMFPGEENKALRHLIYSQGRILNAPTPELGMLRVEQFLKGASVDEYGNFKTLTPRERAERNAAGIPAPVFDPKSVIPQAELPAKLDKTGFLQQVAELLPKQDPKTGITPIPQVPVDLNPEHVPVSGDLTKPELEAAFVVPPSHIGLGTVDVLGLARKGKGVFATAGDLPQADKLVAQVQAYHIMKAHGDEVLGKMKEYGIENHSDKITKAMQDVRDQWGRAETDYAKAKRDREDNTNKLREPAFKAAERNAYLKKMAAQDACDEAMLRLAQDPKYGDARVAMMVDKWDEPPEELVKACSQKEIHAAQWIKNLMDTYRDAAKRAGLPVLEGSYFVHQVKAGLSDDVWNEMQKAGVRYGTTGLWESKVIDPNAEEVQFAHRRPGGQMTLPDLFGGLNEYIPRALNLISKRQVANKWTQAARLYDLAGYKNLAEFINKDMQGYIEGYGSNHPRFDGFIDNMTRAWQAKMTAGKIGTSVKHTAKMPLAVVESGLMNNVEAAGILMHADSLPKDVGDSIRDLARDFVKTGHFSQLELGTGDVKADVYKSAREKLLEASHQPVQITESTERAVNFVGALLDGYKRGLSPMDAFREAAGRSLITNFSPIDQPGYARSSAGRAIGVFQSTVNKIMWLNIKRTGDIIKGIEATVMKDRQLDPEAKRKLAVGIKAAAMMSAVAYASHETDTPYIEWMSEIPTVYKAIYHMTKLAASHIWNPLADKQHQWHPSDVDLKRDLSNGFDLAPMATQAITNLSKYGLETGAVDTLTPQFAKDWAFKKSPQTALRYGKPGVERKIRELTGAYKPSVKEEQEEQASTRTESRQAGAAKKWGASWHNPLGGLDATE